MITVTHVTKRFGDFVALDDVSLEVPDGSLTALLGPSGSGKSTLLRIIGGLETADAGTVTIHGEDVTNVTPQKRGIGFVFQHYAAFKHMSVAKNVAFGLEIRKTPKAEVKRRVGELLELVHLSQFADRLPSQLSGGQRQRMALARALAVEPTVLLLDEPFEGLAPIIVDELAAALRGIVRDQGIAAIIVEQNARKALAMTDEAVILDRGRIVHASSSAELLQDHDLMTAHLGVSEAAAGG